MVRSADGGAPGGGDALRGIAESNQLVRDRDAPRSSIAADRTALREDFVMVNPEAERLKAAGEPCVAPPPRAVLCICDVNTLGSR